MDAAQTIRDCIADVTALRLHRTGDPALGAAVGSVKSLQARRFRGTYADLMGSPAFGPAARFFLEELYSDTRYTAAWRTVGQRHARAQHLQRVLAMGNDLARLTRTPGLRMMLRMMRGPANAAGMGALQRFLEAGFDTFGPLARQRGGVEQFLATIEQRERALMGQLFDADPVTCGTQLANTLGQAR